MLLLTTAHAAPPNPPKPPDPEGAAARLPSGAPTLEIVGHVVLLDEGDIVVDLGEERGLAAGALVELWRPLVLEHPLSGEKLRERFRTGTLRLIQVRSRLALARPHGKLERKPVRGDIVILRRPRETGRDPALPAKALPRPRVDSAAPAQKENAGDPVARNTEGAAGADAPAQPDPKRAAGEQPLLCVPKTPARRRPPEPDVLSYAGPEKALAGEPLAFGVEVTRPATALILHHRKLKDPSYNTLRMTRSGERYFVALLPGSHVEAPGIEYFIEVIGEGGRAIELVGAIEEPQRIAVAKLPTASASRGYPAAFHVSTDYADWNQLRGNDTVWQTEGSVGLRFRDVGLRAVRTGFGVYRGVGGSLEELDQLGLSARRVGLTYGYLESEIGVSRFTGLVARLAVGLQDDGISGGAQAFVRLGNDRETNLLIGGETLGGVGFRGITELNLNAFPKVPVVLRTEITNQPAGVSDDGGARPSDPGATFEQTSHAPGSVGARAIAEVGYRVLPSLVLAVRGSYQGRTIRHAGPGLGGAVTYQW